MSKTQKRRIYMSSKRVAFYKRRQKANNDLLEFKDKSIKAWEERGKSPNIAEVSFDLYESLLEADYGLRDKQPRLIGELFGIKIKVDPMLKNREIKFVYE